MWSPALLVYTLTALLIACLRPNWRIVLSWLFCIGAVYAMGLYGRPAIVRVYVPLLYLLIIAPFLIGKGSLLSRRVSTTLVLLAALLAAYQLCSTSKRVEARVMDIRKGFVDFPAYSVVTWGASFPFEELYPVLRTSNSKDFQLYPFGVFTLAPFSTAFSQEQEERGFVSQFVSEAGVPIVASDFYFTLLDAYCSERLDGEVKVLSVKKYGAIAVSRRRCQPYQ